MKRLLLGVTTALVPALFGLQAAKAGPVTISLAEPGYATVSDNAGDATPSRGFTTTPATPGSPGQVTYVGSFGSFALNVTTGTGGAKIPQDGIDLNSTDTASARSVGGVLTLTVSEIGFAGSTGLESFLASIGGTISGSISKVTYAAYVDPSNKLYGLTDLVYSNTYSGLGSFGSNGFATLAPSSNYSMTEVISITSTGGLGQVSFDAQLLPVPEPGTLTLMGGSLMVFGLVWTRRRKQG